MSAREFWRERVLANRAVSVPALTVRRFFAIDGLRKAMLLAFNLYVALIPLTIIAFAALSSMRRNIDLGDLMVNTFRVRGETAEVMRNTFASNPSILRVASFIAVVSFAISGFDVAAAFQRTFAEAWDVTPLRGWRGPARGALWFLLVFATFGITQVLQRLSGRHGWWVLVFVVPMVGAMNYLFWLITPRFMLDKHLDWADLRPGAVIGTIGSTGLWLVSLLVLPGWFDWYGRGFGAIGIALALLSWTYVVAIVWVVVVVAFSAYWEHTATVDEVLDLLATAGPADGGAGVPPDRAV